MHWGAENLLRFRFPHSISMQNHKFCIKFDSYSDTKYQCTFIYRMCNSLIDHEHHARPTSIECTLDKSFGVKSICYLFIESISIIYMNRLVISFILLKIPSNLNQNRRISREFTLWFDEIWKVDNYRSAISCRNSHNYVLGPLLLIFFNNSRILLSVH